MRNRVDISDIRKRKAILAESSEMTNTKTMDNYYELAKKGKFTDIRHFMQECGKTRYNSTAYIMPCIEYLEEDGSPELLSIFKSEILPRVNDYEIRYLSESIDNKDLKDLVNEQVIKNKIADRVISNHENITKSFDICSLYESSNINVDENIKLACTVIDTFNVPTYAKINIGIEENAYILQMYGMKYNDRDLARSVLEFFSIAHTFNENEIDQINKVLKENYMIEDLGVTKDAFKSNILEVIDKYIMRSEHNAFEIPVVNEKIFNSDPIDWLRNIGSYFALLRSIVLYGDPKSKEAVIDIISMFADKVYDTFGACPNFKDIVFTTRAALDKEIVTFSYNNLDRIKQYNADVQINIDTFERFKNDVADLFEKFTEWMNVSYTEENVRYMTERVICESSDIVTIYEYKDHKYDPLIYKMYKFDRMIQKEVRGWAKKTGQKIADTIEDIKDKVKEKMYEEVSIYEMIVGDHIDYVVEKSYFDPEIVNMDEIHNMATSIVKTFNESELKNEKYMSAYYTLEANCINFHIKDDTELFLSDVDKLIVEEATPIAEIDSLVEPMFIATCIDENFDLYRNATKFFTNNPTGGYFEVFSEACSLAGITKETLLDIYENVRQNTGSEFVIENSYYMNSYVENKNPDPYIATRALMVVQAMLEDTSPVKKPISEPKKDPKAKVKVTPKVANSKVTDTVKNTKNVTTSKMSDVKEKTKSTENPLKGINLNNLKLYVAGLRKNMKDLDSKTQTAVKTMDFTVEKLIKDIKGALVSDRRESIIKGSIIPSFHKCILIAVGLATLSWFNLPLAVITAVGGFAASKKLTERERALMLDDIEIELELLDKEINMADSRNQIKKMRQLMKMKKNLQREYQRIKYNIRLGKDIIPSGSYVPSKE